MTDPQFGPADGQGGPPPSSWQPPPGQPVPPGQYPPPPPGSPYSYPPPAAMYADPAAPYGRNPVTGEPYSDKSKLIGGLLQLLGLIGLLGFGRMYVGQTGLGIVQLLVCLIVSAVTCGVGIFVPIIWGIVDAVLFFTGNVRDAHGRPLRDGG